MSRLRPMLVLLVLLLASGATAAQDAQSEFFVNVVRAGSLGCSPDSLTQPDLRVQVFVNGALVLETPKAQDQDQPLFGHWASVRATLPATIEVQVQEAEPGGFFFVGTSWVDCQTGAGGTNRSRHEYRGEPVLEIDAHGEGARAALAKVVVGTARPAPPVLRVDEVGGTTARLSWTGAPSPGAQEILVGNAGRRVATVAPDARAHTLEGLLDDEDYTWRIVQTTGAWALTSEDVTARTTNLPPAAPSVTKATQDAGAAHVEWEPRTTHDIVRYEVHAGAGDFAPGDSSLRGQAAVDVFEHPTSLSGVALQPGDTHVRVRAVDRGGLDSVSAAVALVAAPAPAEDDESGTEEPPWSTPPADGRNDGVPPEGGGASGDTSAGTVSTTRGDDGMMTLPVWVVVAMLGLAGLLGLVAVLLARQR